MMVVRDIMHNDNYVCFECRIVRKGNGSCDCHRPLVCVSHKWRFPKKRDKKGWARIKELVMQNPYNKQQMEARDKLKMLGEKLKAGDICAHCNVHLLVKVSPAYEPDYLYCPNCDSTFLVGK